MKAHTTGLTIALAALLAVALSFAPIPGDWKPIPSLDRTRPVDTLARAFLPAKASNRSPSTPDALVDAPQLANAPSGYADPRATPTSLPGADDADDAAPSPPLPPAAALGAPEARAVRRLERWVQKLGAKHVDFEQGCLEQDSEGACTRRALDGFFDALEATQRGERIQPVRILHLGDSQIASDYISDTIRRRLELRYGAAGPGFLFIDRPTRFAGRKVRTGDASDGWKIVKLTDKERDGLLGATGVRFTASEGRQRTRFSVAQARTAEISFVTRPNGGMLEVFADNSEAPIARLFTRFPETAFAQSRVRLPKGAKTLSFATSEGEVSLFGVSLESGGPGIVYDSVGLPGAMYEVYLRATESTFAAQLRHRDPSLIVLMLGGNEAYEIGRGWQSLEDVKSNATALIDRIQRATPKAACLVLSPMEAGIRSVSGEIEPRPHTEEVGAALREIALAHGCAFWDLHAALGGRGSVSRWLSHGLFNSDLVHPLPAGAEIIGHLFDFALERARIARPRAQSWSGDEPGLVDPTGSALSRTFARLEALRSDPKTTEHVSIVQLGASHTASHLFTDVLRADLANTFGAAGRGFVAAGRPSDRLAPSGVKRELRGEWQMLDARDRPVGEPFGLTGIRAVGQPHASMSITFGDGQDGGREPAHLSLYFLESPEMGKLIVRIDGKEVAALGPETANSVEDAPTAQVRPPRAGRFAEPLRPSSARATTGAPTALANTNPPAAPADPALAVPPGSHARIVRFPVKGTSHTIEVENAGPGLATLFGASMDQDRGGVVLDALGLPGATASVLNGYDAAAFVEQLKARRADLYILFFGTNESASATIDAQALADTNSTLLRTLHAASPDAECLIIGPTDRLEKRADGTWAEAPSNALVVRTLREVARQEGCAFWSARAAMGGPRSMARWQSLNPPLGNEDGVHLTPEGYAALAHALSDDLLSAWRAHASPRAAPRPILRGEGER